MLFASKIEDVIADFRGLPRTVTESSRRDPTPLDSLLIVIEERYRLKQASPERTIVENWEAIFGSRLAGRCHPVRIKNEETLIISVTNQTLRSEVAFMKRSIIKRVRELEHCGGIRDLIVRG